MSALGTGHVSKWLGRESRRFPGQRLLRVPGRTEPRHWLPTHFQRGAVMFGPEAAWLLTLGQSGCSERPCRMPSREPA
jgi:hypothetical protein